MTENIRSNVYKHGTKILRSIAEHYESGGIESPEANHMMMQLFALVVEGKVRGIVCEDTGMVKWSLTESFEKEIEQVREQAIADATVVRGPW